MSNPQSGDIKAFTLEAWQRFAQSLEQQGLAPQPTVDQQGNIVGATFTPQQMQDPNRLTGAGAVFLMPDGSTWQSNGDGTCTRVG